MRIDMFVYNRCTTDARVLKEAKTLAEVGHSVRIVAVLDNTTKVEEQRDGFRIVRIDRNPIHYRILRMTRSAGQIWRLPLNASRRTLERLAPGFLDSWRSLAGRNGSDRRTKAPALIHGRGRASTVALIPLVLLVRGLDLAFRGLKTAIRAAGRAGRRIMLAPHKPLMFFDYYLRAYRLVRADPPEALHAHDLNTLPVAAALARRLDLPLTYDAHELYPEISTLSRREAATWGFLERRLAKRADHLITVCDSIAAEIEYRYGVARPTVLLNCPVAPGANGQPGQAEIADVQPRDRDATNALRSRAGLDANLEPLVLYQGGFAPHRGLDTLVRSAHRLDKGTIILMGWGRLEEDLRELISREGLGQRVKITSPVPQQEVVAYASGATVGVIPYEPVGLNNTFTTPNKLFDYMAANLPIVVSRLPELTRFVENAQIGLTFPPGNPSALGDALNEILTNPDRCRRMRERARESSRRYTWEQESSKLLALYEGL